MSISRFLTPADEKRWLTVRARLALVGLRAQLVDDNTGWLVFIISSHQLLKSFHSLDAVEAFAGRVGAPG